MTDDFDDGLGPYHYCKRGRSRCDDQTCHCVDSLSYRVMYWRARDAKGWGGHVPNAAVTVRGLIFWPLCGMLVGLSLVLLVWWWLSWH